MEKFNIIKKTLSITLVVFVLFTSCKNQLKKEVVKKETENVQIADTFPQIIEKAHKKTEFLAKEAIQFNAVITFGGNEIFNATITISTTSDLARITYKNGDEIRN